MNGWVPISVSLPQAFATVVVHGGSGLGLAFHDGEVWCHATGPDMGLTHADQNISHWLNIPDLP